MKGRRTGTRAVAALAVAAGTLVVAPAPGHAQTPGGDAATLVVKLAPDATIADLEASGATVETVVADDTFVVDVDPAEVRSVDDLTVWAEPDVVYRAARLPSDECLLGCPAASDGQPELGLVDAFGAWDVTTGSSAVTVAVLDGPADASHPDLAGKVTVGPSFVSSDCFEAAPASHGTAVAGIVGASTDNGIGIASLGWNTSVLSVAVLDRCGAGTASAIAAGMRWAAQAGADVVNLSLTGAAHPAVQEAVAELRASGVVVVAAAGNAGSTTPVYPAAYPGVIGVAATDEQGVLASFSNRGAWVDVAAPGRSVVSTSTLPGGYASYDGTSFAAPMISATAALLLATRPSLTPDELAQRIRATSVPVDGIAWGRLDAARALEEPRGGYWLASADGRVFSFGDAPYRGSAGDPPLAAPIVGMAPRPTGGYWLAGRDGGIFSFGGAPFLGSTGNRRLNQPIVGMAPTPSGNGYWLVAADGGVFSFGDAPFRGSTGNRRLNQPIVGMAPTPSGNGYWLVAADGGVFSFGDAPFLGSTGGLALVSPIVGMAAPATGGYWLAAADGGVFSFGVPFYGSGAGLALAPVTGVIAEPDGRGYRLATASGSVLTFGAASSRGELTGGLTQPVVAIAAAPR